jgi:hypothetical protein
MFYNGNSEIPAGAFFRPAGFMNQAKTLNIKLKHFTAAYAIMFYVWNDCCGPRRAVFL